MLVLILLCYGTEAYRTTARWLHCTHRTSARCLETGARAAARKSRGRARDGTVRVYSCLIYNEARLYAMGVKAWRASFRTRMHQCP